MKIGTKNSTSRDQWIKHSLAALPQRAKILDAGAGEQPYKQFCTHLEYTSQDFDSYDGTGDAKGLQMGEWNSSSADVTCDIINMPFENESFDAVLCTEVIEHTPEPLEVFRELSRILKKGGCLLLTAPFCSLTHFAPYHFYSGFNKYFYEYACRKYDLSIKELCENGDYFEYIAQELRRVPSTGHRYARLTMQDADMEVINALLRCLAIMSKADENSSELLCYGYHLKAIRN